MRPWPSVAQTILAPTLLVLASATSEAIIHDDGDTAYEPHAGAWEVGLYHSSETGKPAGAYIRGVSNDGMTLRSSMLFELGCWVMRGFNVGIPAHVAPSDWQPLSERWSDVRARVDLGQIHEIEVDYSIAPDWMEGAIAIALDPVSSEPIYHALDGDALYLEMGPREGGERLYMRLPLEGARSAYRRARDLCLESDPALHFVAPERIHVEIDLD